MHEKKPIPVDELDFDVGYALKYSDGAGNLTAAEAPGAHIDVLGATVYYGLNALDIGLPGTIGTSVRVADLNAEGYVLTAKITLCHFQLHLLACTI